MRAKTFQDKADMITSVKISEISQSVLNHATKIGITSEASLVIICFHNVIH